MTCSHDDCRDTPRWTPVVEFAVRKSRRRVTVRYARLLYCDGHREKLELKDILSDEAAVKTAKFARERGLGQVDKKSAHLSWNEVTLADAEKISETQDHTRSDESLPF